MAAYILPTPAPHTEFMPGYALDNMLEQEVSHLVSDLQGVKPPLVTKEDLQGLPAPVQCYLVASHIIGKPRTLFARWRFQGHFRRSATEKWMPMTAEQYNRVDKPARLWYAKMNFMPVLNFYVRDAYQNDEGNMYAKLTPWYQMFDERCPELTQGELVILLNDMVFFPSALLSPYIRWEAVDEYSARAYLLSPSMTISALFYFNEKYDVVDFVADRYRQHEDLYVMTKWSTPFTGHQEVNGVRIPTEGEAVWHIPDNTYAYARLSLVDIQYNVFARYP
jgi:hypothetical protein